MSESSRSPDRFATTFDHEGLVANAGLILAGTLMARLGVSALIERWVRTGSANPGPKILTVVAAMLAGGTHIDHVEMLRAGRTGRVLGFRPMAPSTVGTLLADVHVRSHPPARSGAVAHAGARLGTGRGPRQGAAGCRSGLHDLRGPRQTKTRRRVRLTKELGYHPLLATRADTGEVLGARMRKGSAGSSRGVARFADELVANLRRAGAAGPTTVRADSGWLVPQADRPSRRPRHQMVDHRRPQIRCARSDPSNPQHRLGPTSTTPTAATPKSPKRNRVRPRQSRNAPSVVVRRTRLAEGAQQRLWPDWRHHAFITNTETRHRRRGRVPPRPRRGRARHPRPQRRHRPRTRPLRPLRSELRTGSPAPCSPTTSATGRTRLGAPPCHEPLPPHPTRRPRRRAAVNRSGTPTLRYPARWPWETQFTATLSALRARPDPPAAQPGTDAPTQTQRRQPRTTPAPLAQHAQTHQTTPPTTRRDPNPPPTREPHAHQRPIGVMAKRISG